MSLDEVKTLLVIISGLFALVTAVITAFWAYSKFILERGLIPATELQIELNTIGFQDDKVVLEVLVHLKNIGSSTLIARNIRVDLRYLQSTDKVALFDKERSEGDKLPIKEDVRFGKVFFPHSLIKELREGYNQHDFKSDPQYEKDNDIRPKDEKRGFKVIAHHTFVQPGVDQIYTFATALPGNSSFVLVYSSFAYEQHPKDFQIAILRLCRKLGLIQYSLNHIYEAHSVERVFTIKEVITSAISKE